LLRRFARGAHLSIDTFVSERDRKEATRILASLEPDDATRLVYKGVPVGKFSLIDHIIFRRKRTSELDYADLERFKGTLLSAMISISSLQRIMAKENPDRILLYNGLYPVERCVAYLGKEQGITTYYLHGAPNWHRLNETLDFGHSNVYAHSTSLKDYWRANHEAVCLSKKNVNPVISHYKSLIFNTSGYDLSKRVNFNIDLSRRIGRKPNTRLVLVALSSYDEYLAAFASGALDFETTIFESQLDWLAAIVNFARKNERYHFVIRIHPREYKVDRFGERSEILQDLTYILETRPENVYVNEPSDGLSLFDFVPDVDLLLTSWSTVSEDFACLGVPVLTYHSKVLMFPDDLVTVCQTTADDYFDTVRYLAEGCWSVDKASKALRWRVLRLHEVTYKMPKWYVASVNRSLFTRLTLRIFKVLDELLIEKLQLTLSKLPFRKNAEIAELTLSGGPVARFSNTPKNYGDPRVSECLSVDYFLRIVFEEILRQNWNEVWLRKFNVTTRKPK
jgi:hypothetical protein